MKITNSFKAVQRHLFQDKQIYCYASKSVKGDFGGVTTCPNVDEPLGNYLVNFRYIQNEKQREEFGANIQADAVVTCSDSLPILQGEFIRYNNHFFEVTGRIDRDSHTKWAVSLYV